MSNEHRMDCGTCRHWELIETVLEDGRVEVLLSFVRNGDALVEHRVGRCTWPAQLPTFTVSERRVEVGAKVTHDGELWVCHEPIASPHGAP